MFLQCTLKEPSVNQKVLQIRYPIAPEGVCRGQKHESKAAKDGRCRQETAFQHMTAFLYLKINNKQHTHPISWNDFVTKSL